MADPEELKALRAENARLATLLEAHGIPWREPAARGPDSISPLSTDAKIALFRGLFRGRTDVYATRWENQATGKSGYAPACANTWRHDLSETPRLPRAQSGHRVLQPLTDSVIHDHLAGRHTVGLYPLLQDDRCYLLAVDFDEAEWQDDARAFVQSCTEWDVPAALEISRSGHGAHVWIFFTEAVPARDARRLGTALISHTCARTRQLQLTSYDRLFPNQDTLPQGGFGNLIALPLQRGPRMRGCSVFVDAALRPYPDQWAFLATLQRMDGHAIDATLLRVAGGAHPLDITFIDDEDLAAPWQRTTAASAALPGSLPKSLTVVLANQVYFEKAQLPQALANRLIRLAAFQNPAFYRAQAMHRSVWNKPRVIGCAENYPQHIALPRGCLDAALSLLHDHSIACDLRDERCEGRPLQVAFVGTLRPEQAAAMTAMLKHDTGVLCAPTAFGKTIVAAAMLARRAVNTLILVHRADLRRQWQERLRVFLTCENKTIGTLGGSKAKPTGAIDIALMQSVSRRGQVDPLVETYGQVIIDECHHVGAASFDTVLKRVRAKYVLGLTATPVRRDGQQPIVFMQCGPIRHTAGPPPGAPGVRSVVPHFHAAQVAVPPDAGIQEVFRTIASDRERTRAIARETLAAFEQGRKILVLTQRTQQLIALQSALIEQGHMPFVLHGRLSKKQRTAVIGALDALPPDTARIVLATGKLVGEGFDHPPLDTLVLAMPISWKGTLHQYAGRLHRQVTGKHDVRIIDFVDTGHPALLHMWQQRQRGYRAMGYQVMEAGRDADALLL